MLTCSSIFTASQQSCGKVMFSVVSVNGVGGSHVTITHDALNLTIRHPNPPRTGTPLQTCSTWTSLYIPSPPYPLPKICSNLFIMKHVWLASGRLASYWNAFLFLFAKTIYTLYSGTILIQASGWSSFVSYIWTSWESESLNVAALMTSYFIHVPILTSNGFYLSTVVKPFDPRKEISTISWTSVNAEDYLILCVETSFNKYAFQ